MKFRNTSMGILFRRFLARWFFLPIYIFQYFNIYLKLFRTKQQPLVIILTIGKVGSSSVYYSLKKEFTNRIFHIHFFSEEGINQSWNEHKFSSRKSIPMHLITSRILQKFIKYYSKKIYIITIFREPIGRKISSFYQNLDKNKDKVNMKGLKFDSSEINYILNDDYFLNTLNEEDYWIKDELQNTFGFEIYKKRNIEEKGFIIERKGRMNLLVYKMETLNKLFSDSIKEFFEINENIDLKMYNKGEKKYYNRSYSHIKRSLKLDEMTLDKICSTDYFNTFYSDIKLSTFKNWKK